MKTKIGDRVDVMQDGDSKWTDCDVIWSGTCDVYKDERMECILAKEILQSHNLLEETRDIACVKIDDEWVELFGRDIACREWYDFDDNDPSEAISKRIDDAINGLF